MAKKLILSYADVANLIGTNPYVLGRLGIGLRDPVTVTHNIEDEEWIVTLADRKPKEGSTVIQKGIHPEIGDLFELE